MSTAGSQPLTLAQVDAVAHILNQVVAKPDVCTVQQLAEAGGALDFLRAHYQHHQQHGSLKP